MHTCRGTFLLQLRNSDDEQRVQPSAGTIARGQSRQPNNVNEKMRRGNECKINVGVLQRVGGAVLGRQLEDGRCMLEMGMLSCNKLCKCHYHPPAGESVVQVARRPTAITALASV